MIRNIADLIFSLCIVLVVSWFVWDARSWPIHSRLFPWSIGVVALSLALVQLFMSVRETIAIKKNTGSEDSPRERQEPPDAATPWRIMAIGSWIALFLFGIWLLGFRVGSLVLTLAFLKLAAGESPKNYLILGLGNYLFFLVVFDLTLGVPLFEGAFARWLGIEALDKGLGSQIASWWHSMF